ncbi:MAG: cobalamin-dependent protein [Deltaproteobacteria bacterium]|nr:cobalamin-dependent protein [Deltaproteobacteria bacterium]
MKLLFIHCNINTGNGRHFVPGIAGISSVLKAAGHETALLFLQEGVDREALVKKIEAEQPDLIGFSTLTNQMRSIRQYTRWIKEEHDIPVIYGGIHATICPEDVARHDDVDFICIGEGEFPVLELLEQMEKGGSGDNIPNLWVRQPDGRFIKNPLRPLMHDLDALPFPDHELFKCGQLLLENPMEATFLMAGRGCPFTCKYCCNHVLQERYRGLGKYCRLRSQERVLEEIRYLLGRYDIKRLVIFDDTFTYNYPWLMRFCQLYRDEFDLPFAIQVRVDTVDEKILRMLKEAGCDMIIAGIESGSERIRHGIMNRKMTNERIVNVYKTADALGLKTWANYIIGLPTETPEDVEETFAINRIIRPNNIQVSIFFPYPKTALFDLCSQEGYLSDRESNGFFGESILNLPTLTKEQILEYVNKLKAEAVRIKLEKEQSGEFDFLVRFPEARLTTEHEAYVRITSEIIDGEERSVIFAHPESRISYTLSLPENARLCFGIGMSPPVWSKEKGSGVDFEITMNENGRERLLFSRYIDPKNNPDDRKWHDITVDLPEHSSHPTQLNFITTTKGRDKQFCWAVWSQPFLDRRKQPA